LQQAELDEDDEEDDWNDPSSEDLIFNDLKVEDLCKKELKVIFQRVKGALRQGESINDYLMFTS
jgi:hypothetical protein